MRRGGFWRGRPLRTRVTELASALGELGIWVRLHYLYPYPHVDELLPLMADGRILPYLDVPLQHASPAILRAMKRPGDVERMLERVRRWRDACPDLTLRSTFIVGFPGESEDDFLRLLDFLEEARLDRVGAFAYSPVEGAPANALPDPVPETLKQERLERLMEVQEQISAARLERRIGSRMRVLVDEVEDDGLAVARSRGDAPEIDGAVLIEDGAGLEVGEFAEVEIVSSDAHDLWARVESNVEL